MKYGQRISELRKEKGLSQYRLAKITGISQGLIGDYERGRSNPKTENLQKICSALGLTVTEFLADDSAEARHVTPSDKKMAPPTDYEAWEGALRKLGAINDDGSIDYGVIDAYLDFRKTAGKLADKSKE